MTQKYLDLQCCFFVVDERPLCLWDQDVRQRTLRFLDSIDPSYFDYLRELYISNINNAEEATDKDAQHAALAIRAAYSQALETLFALIFATIQSPWCVPAWINAYKNHELHNLVKKVHEGQQITSILETETPSWANIIDFLFPTLGEDKKYESAIKNNLSETWLRFAHDFLDGGFSREYNSIKHGLRVRPGGFKFCVGIPDKPEVAPPEEKMFTLTSSDFGSAYLNSEKIGNWSNHICLRGELRNWYLDSLAWSLKLASISIANVKSSLQAMNGEGSQVFFRCPDPSEIDKWKGFANMTMPELTILPEYITPFSKDEILANYKSKTFFSRMRIEFSDEEEAD